MARRNRRGRRRSLLSIENERVDKKRIQKRVERRNDSKYARDKVLGQRVKELDLMHQRPKYHGINSKHFAGRVRDVLKNDIYK